MSTGRRAYDMLRSYVSREWDRVRDLDELNARTELDAPTIPRSPSEPVVVLTDKQKARNILAVSQDASFEEIRRAFDRLNKRADPSRFAEGSDEREMATQLQAQINWAYKQLTDDLGTTEKRFKSLELE